MCTAQQVNTLALQEVGTTESPAGSNLTKYGQAYGSNGVPWCAIFVWWVFWMLGCADLLGGKTAYTPTLAGQFKKMGRWSTSPEIGAVVFYDFPDSKDRIQHVGLVVAYNDSYIWAVEGNTSFDDHGSQDNGGAVAKKKRPRNASIVGYGLPNYDEEAVDVAAQNKVIIGFVRPEKVDAAIKALAELGIRAYEADADTARITRENPQGTPQ